MKKKKSLIISLILCIVFVVCACKRDEEPSTTPNTIKTETKTKEYQALLDVISPQAYSQVTGLNLEPGTYISIIGRSSGGDYWESVKAGAQQAASDVNEMLGYKGEDKIKVNYSGPSEGNNVDEQINILDEELARYPSAVGIAIIDAQACEVQFDLAAENGIPIAAFDSGSDYRGIVSMVGTNNKEAAKTAAVKLAAAIEEEGEVFLVVHDSKSTTGKEREAAAMEEITANYPGVTVVETIHLDGMKDIAKIIATEKNALLTEGQTQIDPTSIKEEDVFKYYFEKYPNVKGALSTNVDATQSIIASRAKLGGNFEEFQIVGFDGGEKQLASLEKEEVAGLVVQNPFAMGYASVIASARAILEQGNEAIVDCGYTWVTGENMETDNINRMLY